MFCVVLQQRVLPLFCDCVQHMQDCHNGINRASVEEKVDEDTPCPVPMDQTPTSVVAAHAEEKGTLPSVDKDEEESAVTSSLFICPCNKKHTLFGRCCRHIRDECSKGSESVLCNLSKDKKAAVAEANESNIGARFSVQIPHVSVLSNTKKVPSNIGRLVTNSTHRRTMQPK